jgi:hypothetical protein
MIIDKFLYEIIDDYKNATSEKEKSEIFKDFCSFLWSSKNKRRTYTKTIKFKVRNDLLETEIGKIFNTWSEVDYVGYKAMTKDTDWCSLIRQKINNLYTRYFDENVILKKEYMNLLKTPYNLYFRWTKGTEMNADELLNAIETSIHEAEKTKVVYQKQKMKLSWDKYKNIVEGFLQKILDNCSLIEDYELEHLTDKYIYELANEDNSYIKYICDNLEGYMRNYQKKYYGLSVPSTTKQHKQYKRCKECGALIEKTGNKKMYCDECATKIRAKKRIKYNSDYYKKCIKNK